MREIVAARPLPLRRLRARLLRGEQRRARRLHVVIGRVGREAGRGVLLLVLRLLEQRQLVRLGRERARLAQLLGARGRAARLLERGARERHLRPRRAARRLGGVEPGLRPGLRARIERQRLEARDHGARLDGVAGVELAAQQRAPPSAP